MKLIKEDLRAWGQEDIDNQNALESIVKKLKEVLLDNNIYSDQYDEILYDIFDYGNEIIITNINDIEAVQDAIESDLGFPFRIENGYNIVIDTTQEYEDEEGNIKTRVSREYLNESKLESNKCALCGKELKGYGNNGQPLVDGTVCDECNKEVIKARINSMKNEKLNESNENKVEETKTLINTISTKLYEVRDLLNQVKSNFNEMEIESMDIDPYFTNYIESFADTDESALGIDINCAELLNRLQTTADLKENVLKDAQEKAEKDNKGKKQGFFVNMNAGDVEKGTEMFNNAATPQSAPVMEEIEPKTINIRDELFRIDTDANEEFRNLLGMYESVEPDLNVEEKKRLVDLIIKNDLEGIDHFLVNKLDRLDKPEEDVIDLGTFYKPDDLV